MTLLDDTLTTAADLGRATAHQATGAASLAGRGISDAARGISEAAHQGQTVFDDLGDTVTGPDRNTGRRIMVLAAIAAIVGIVIWRRRSEQGNPEQSRAPEATAGTTPGASATPEAAMSPNVDVAARTNAHR